MLFLTNKTKGIMTERFLQHKSSVVFWLCVLLGFPWLIWLLSIVIELNKRVPKSKKISLTLILIPFLYTLFFVPGSFVLFMTGKVSFLHLIPFHLLGLVSVILMNLHATNAILNFEKHHHLQESNKLGLIFGMWYFVFGVWYIQPKLNQYIDSASEID